MGLRDLGLSSPEEDSASDGAPGMPRETPIYNK